MADELKQSQLARIVVPAITDVKYAEGMADAFDKINDNFKKIASLPFLQGVQGDSYQLEEYPIWEEEDSGNWILTEDGKVLLDSIFGRDVTKDRNGNDTANSFATIRANIEEELDGVSPLDFFKDGNDIINNTLYFYVIKDDTGNVIEKQLGQFYYFIDGRIKNIGTVYGDKNSSEILSTFNDYTGFYQYRYNPKSYLQKYLRVEILPSIYYDQNKNDICWKFNGNETGISAIGIEGKSGKDATLSIVKVTANSSDVSGVVEAEFKYDATNKTGEWDNNNLQNIKEGKAIICCYYQNYKIGNTAINVKGEKINVEDLPSSGNEIGDGWFIQGILFAWDGSKWIMLPQGLNFAYGELIRSEDDVLNAYWNPGTMFSHVINDMKITSYFYDMGDNAVASAPHYLAIPSDSDRITGENLNAAHVIRNSSGDLEFFNSSDAFVSPEEQNQSPTGATGTPKTVKLTNYNFKVGKEDDINVHISNDKVRVGSTSYIGSTSAVIDGELTVKNLTVGATGNPGKTNLYGETNIYKGGLYIGATENTSPNGIIIEKGDIQLRNGNLGVTGAINASGDLTIGGNGNIKGQTLTLGFPGESGSGKSTTIILNGGSYDPTYGKIMSKFSLDANESRTDNKRYFTINSFSQYYPYGEKSYNMARICVGSTASNGNKENYIQICAGEDSIYSNPGARAGIQIHTSSDGTTGDVKIKPNLTVEGPGTFKGVITGTTGTSAIFNGDISITNKSTTTTDGNLVIIGASDYEKDISNSLYTLINNGNKGHLLIGASKDDKEFKRMLLNRASIQTYLYNGSTYSEADLYLNPGGGNVNISKSGSTTTIKGSAIVNDKTTMKGGVEIENGANIKSGGLSVPLNNGIKLTGLGSWGAIPGYIDIQENVNHRDSHPKLVFTDLMSTDYKSYSSNGYTSPGPAYGKGLVVLSGTGNDGDSEKYSIIITNCPSNTLFYFGVKVLNRSANPLNNVSVRLTGKDLNEISDPDKAKRIYIFEKVESGENSGASKEFLVFTDSAGEPMFWSPQQ